jgi:hypothetical protein
MPPVSDSYSVASGKPIHAGWRGFHWPAWRKAMVANSWIEVPTANKLSDLNPENDPLQNPNYPGSALWHGTTGFAGIISAYCGACYDQDTDTMHFPLQGGHGDYAGNEPYKIRFDIESPAFQVLRPPSGALNSSPFVPVLDDGQQSTGLYSDGRMRAIHSYNKHVYVPGVGPVCSGQGDTYPGQAGTGKVIYFDEVTGEAVFGAAHPLGITPGSSGTYDSLRHIIWHRSSSGERFYKYDIATNSWSVFGGALNISGNSALCYMPEYDCLLWLCNSPTAMANRFAVLDCVTGVITKPAVTGALVGASGLAGEMSPQWVPSLNGAALWHNTSSPGTINMLSPTGNPRTDAWAITQLPVNSGAPTVAAAAGTFGRFAYSSRLEGFFLINAVNQRPYFYALE